MSAEATATEAPVILCGLGHVGWRVLEYLRTAGVPVVVIDHAKEPSDPRLAGVRLIRGDCRDRITLEAAGIVRARGLLVLTSDDLTNISTTLMARSLHPSARIVVRLFNQYLLTRLGKAMTNVVALSTSALTAPLMAVTALTGEVLAAFDVGNERRQIKELAVTEGGPLENQTLAGVITENVQVLGVVPAAGEAQFLRGVSAETRLQSGDSLIVAGMPQAIGKLSGDRDEDQPALRWAGKVRRFARMARRTLLEVDVAVKIAGAVFAVVVLFSTLVFHFGMGEPLAHGVYHTISVMATGGDMGGEKLTEDWQRVFVSFLRIAGAALVAALTAILTHFLLRARLGGVLELRRIPDSGHVIVCGLGNIGFRVMEELLKQHEQVVVIEQSRDSRFLAGARQQGAVVLIGDATLPDVMQAAHAKHARAVVAATSSELANLSIALLARELNPRQRVVVRLHDMLIAKTLRDAVNVRYAMSIADLSAPAFVAALFCDRVHSLFLMAGKLFVVVEIIVQSGETFFQNQPVASLSAEYKLLTIGLFRGGKLLSSGELAECRLQIDDHWTVIAALQDLERMLEREPAVPVSPP